MYTRRCSHLHRVQQASGVRYRVDSTIILLLLIYKGSQWGRSPISAGTDPRLLSSEGPEIFGLSSAKDSKVKALSLQG
ncbi:unnamed protein product [Lampetra fluviatilis]